METSTLLEIAKQVPSLLVLAWVVSKFLAELGKRDAVLSAMSAEWRAAYVAAALVTDVNSKTLGRIEETMSNLRQQTADGVRDGLRDMNCPAVETAYPAPRSNHHPLP